MSSAMSLLDRPQAAERIADAILTLAAAGSDH
jgi:hypothetical protein